MAAPLQHKTPSLPTRTTQSHRLRESTRHNHNYHGSSRVTRVQDSGSRPTDTLGLFLVVAVTAANTGDRDTAAGLLTRLRRLHRDITLVWADGGYTGSLVGWCRDKLAMTLEIVKRTDDMTGFVVLPGRWVAERTFAWLMNSRRLARDYEKLPATSEAVIRWSMITRMSRRLARPRAAGPH
ncbi:transposase [Streptomyces clavuligerus]|uniref:transposase n=1 Tax=Streptomyces clavuligerus TaxID=1901 RepID=UPI001E3C7C86|nr:transposase [Streptomyces clavuligerus]